MSNSLYPKWKEALITGAADSDLDGTDTTGVWVALIDTNDVAYNAAHQYYSDISAAIVGTPMEIGATKSYTNGVFDGADVTFSTVTGDQCEALIIYRKNSGANTTWRLVAYLDTNVTGLPVTPNGGNIVLTWNASGIFAL